jgi:hypothetical protein
VSGQPPVLGGFRAGGIVSVAEITHTRSKMNVEEVRMLCCSNVCVGVQLGGYVVLVGICMLKT